MKLNDTTELDFIEADILYCWGSPSYMKTLKRLNNLHNITVDPDIRTYIEELQVKLLLDMDQDGYEQLFYRIRMKLEKGEKSKMAVAKELRKVGTDDTSYKV